MNDSLESNKRRTNLNSGTPSICTRSYVRSESMCNFLDRKKCTHLVLVLENLKPFSFDHLLQLFSTCCNCRSMVCIRLDLQHIHKSSTYKKHSTPGQADRPHNIVDFDTERCNKKNASLGNAHVLCMRVEKVPPTRTLS